MKCAIVFTIVMACMVVHGSSFIIKKDDIPIATIINVKNDVLSSATDIISDLKHKKYEAVDSIKNVINEKIGVIKGIKDSKVSYLKGAVEAKKTKLAALKAAKKSFLKHFFEAKKAKLSEVLTELAAKTQDIINYKKSIKDSAKSLLSGVVNKVHDKFAKKKALLFHDKTPSFSDNELYVPISDRQYKSLHTYIGKDTPVVAKVFVPEATVEVSN